MSQVSVIIPVYNAERFVEEAVESALAQPATGEVLLIEDASPDGSLAVCERLAAAHERVRLLRHADGGNHGAGASRNVGIEAAQCPYVAFLDADDFYLPGRFERAREMLAADASLDGVYEAVGTHFESDEMRAWWEDERGKGPLTTLSEAIPPEELIATLSGQGKAKGWICTPGFTVRRSLFERTGLFPPELRMAQDGAMWLKMAAVGRLAAGSLDEAVAMRRLHGENRIFTNRGEVHQTYDLQARSHVFEWAVRQGLGPETLQPLLRHHLIYQRTQRIANRWRQRLGLRDLPWLVRLGLRVPVARSHAKYQRYMKEAVYWTSISNRVKRVLGQDAS